MGLLLLQLVFIFISCLNHASSKPLHYNAIFSFGDSYFDTGNFHILESPVLPYITFDHLPYGETFFGHPTGRGCDGRLVIDFIADALGLPMLPPSLLKNQSFIQGANFAVIGATALDLAFFQQHNITGVPSINSSMNVQVGWFQDLKPTLCNTTEKCKEYFSNSLFILGEFGGNDYDFISSAGKSLDEVKSYVPTVVNAISTAAESLLKQGAMHLVVPGNLPTGCVPIILTLYASPNKTDYDPQTGCLKTFNSLGFYHNTMLRQAVAGLRRKYPKARISYADFYEPMIRFLQNPDHFGFTNGTPLRVCCGGGGPYNYNISVVCGQPGVMACQNPFTYINWDGIHLTEAAYNYIASGWLNGPYADPPIFGVTN